MGATRARSGVDLEWEAGGAAGVVVVVVGFCCGREEGLMRYWRGETERCEKGGLESLAKLTRFFCFVLVLAAVLPPLRLWVLPLLVGGVVSDTMGRSNSVLALNIIKSKLLLDA